MTAKENNNEFMDHKDNQANDHQKNTTDVAKEEQEEETIIKTIERKRFDTYQAEEPEKILKDFCLRGAAHLELKERGSIRPISDNKIQIQNGFLKGIQDNLNKVFREVYVEDSNSIDFSYASSPVKNNIYTEEDMANPQKDVNENATTIKRTTLPWLYMIAKQHTSLLNNNNNYLLEGVLSEIANSISNEQDSFTLFGDGHTAKGLLSKEDYYHPIVNEIADISKDHNKENKDQMVQLICEMIKKAQEQFFGSPQDVFWIMEKNYFWQLVHYLGLHPNHVMINNQIIFFGIPVCFVSDLKNQAKIILTYKDAVTIFKNPSDHFSKETLGGRITLSFVRFVQLFVSERAGYKNAIVLNDK